MFSSLKNLSFVAIVGITACILGALMYGFWFLKQESLILFTYIPSFLAYLLFCLAIISTIPVLENFWGIKNKDFASTEIDIEPQNLWQINEYNNDSKKSLTVYRSIIFWTLLINAVLIVSSFIKTNHVTILESLTAFYNRGNDIPHYLDIAQNWYVNDGTDRMYDIVFFPLYPILIRIGHIFTRNYLLSAIIVSNIFAVLSGIMFYKLSQLVCSPKESIKATKFLFIFPSAFFFFIPMTESLFLFLSISCIYFTLKKKYLLVFIFGVLASLTRIQGVILMVPITCELIYDMRIQYLNNELNIKKSLKSFLCLLSFPLGIGIYFLINFQTYGDPLIFLDIQKEHWSQEFSYFWNTSDYLLRYAFDWFKAGEWAKISGISIPNILALWGVLLLIIAGSKKIRPSFTLYSMAYYICTFGATWLLSGPRYSACLFTLAFSASAFASKNKRNDILITSLYIILFIYYFIQFLTNYKVY